MENGWREFSVSIALAALLIGCGAPTATPLPFSKEQAIARATQDAKESVPEVGIQQARVDSSAAELITLAEADTRMGGQRGPGGYGPGQTPTSPVWWVVVRGYFQYEGMAAPPNAAPVCEADERDFVYDAKTGESVGGSIPNTRCAQAQVPEKATILADAEWVSRAKTVGQVISEADLVVRARVSEAPVTRVLRNELPIMDANGKVAGYMTDEMLFSDTVFDILEVFSGKSPSKITVMQTGGTSPDNPRNSIEMRDDPLYHLGEEYVLFLVDISGDPVQAPGRVLYRTVSPFGRYRIEGESVISYGENAKSFGLPATMVELVAQIKRGH